MSNLMWKSDAQLLKVLREEKRVSDKARADIKKLELQITQLNHLINTSGTRSMWVNKYLIRDLTDTRWENNVEGWLEQRDRNIPAHQLRGTNATWVLIDDEGHGRGA
jgi:hypothetical protein